MASAKKATSITWRCVFNVFESECHFVSNYELYVKNY